MSATLWRRTFDRLCAKFVQCDESAAVVRFPYPGSRDSTVIAEVDAPVFEAIVDAARDAMFATWVDPRLPMIVSEHVGYRVFRRRDGSEFIVRERQWYRLHRRNGDALEGPLHNQWPVIYCDDDAIGMVDVWRKPMVNFKSDAAA